MKKVFWLFPLFWLFAACGTLTPSATALPTPTVFLSPTFTPTPNRTQLWQATLAANQTQNAGYNATQGVKHTQVAQTQAVKALTPTITPTPTTTPFPTFGPSTPMSGAEMYQLADESAQMAVERLLVLESYWEKILLENRDYADALSPVKLHIGRLAQEVLWRNPGLTETDDVKWIISQNLAIAGEQEATEYLVALLQDELNRNPNLVSSHEESVKFNGFEFVWISAPNLFGDGEESWVVKVTRSISASWYENWGGAVLAIKKTEMGSYWVFPVNSSWQPFFASWFDVMVGDHTADDIPEILIHREQEHGMGPPMREAWVCVYQWDNENWIPLLAGAKVEIGYRDRWMPSDCLITQNNVGVEYYRVPNEVADILQISKITVNMVCAWDIHYTFRWNGVSYQQSVNVDVPTVPVGPSEFICLDEVLGNWAGTLGNMPDIIHFMEDRLANWPTADTVVPEMDTPFLKLFGSDFRDEFRFQLARLYALSGDLEKATEYFSQVIDQPDDSSSQEWPGRAQRYLNQMSDLHTAEAELTNELFPPKEPTPVTLFAEDIADQAALSMFQNGNVETVIRTLEAAVNDPKLSAYRDELCTALNTKTDLPISIQYRDINDCAAVYYWLAVAYEMHGNEEKAVEFYWYVWQNYPDSFYALVAEDRLVERP